MAEPSARPALETRLAGGLNPKDLSAAITAFSDAGQLSGLLWYHFLRRWWDSRPEIWRVAGHGDPSIRAQDLATAGSAFVERWTFYLEFEQDLTDSEEARDRLVEAESLLSRMLEIEQGDEAWISGDADLREEVRRFLGRAP